MFSRFIHKAGAVMALAFLFSCAHAPLQESKRSSLIIQSPERLPIEFKAPRFFQTADGTTHVAAVSFHGDNAERLEYFHWQGGSELKPRGILSWYRLSLLQLLDIDGTPWALVSGRPTPNDRFRQIYLINLQTLEQQGTVVALTATPSHHLNASAVVAPDPEKLVCLAAEEMDAQHSRLTVQCLPLYNPKLAKRAVVMEDARALVRRPSLVWERGLLVLAWDEWWARRLPELSDPDYDIMLARFALTEKKGLKLVHGPLPLLSGSALTAAPQLQVDADKLYLAFHSNHQQALLKVWELVRVEGGHVQWPMWLGRPEYATHFKMHEHSQGSEFPVLAVSGRGDQPQFALLARPSHGATLALARSGHVEEWELDQDGWGARDLVGQIVWTAPNELLLARRGHKQSTLERVQLPALPARESQAALTWQAHTGVLEAPPLVHVPLPMTEVEKDVFFGDVHTHSGHSDGTGPSDEIYARLYQRGMHFAVLTDHDNIVGSRLFPSQHEENQIITDWFDALPDFTTLQAFEWTTPPLPRGHGHKNIYFEGETANPVFSFKGEEKDVPSLYRAMEHHRAFAAPHHSAWTGINWQEMREEFEPQFEIASVHGVFETKENNPFKTLGDLPGMYARDGLTQGKRYGFIAGSDAHGLLEHHGNGRHIDPWGHGLTGVRLPRLNRANLWRALQSKQSWATTGTPIELELQADKKKSQQLLFKIKSPDIIRQVELVIDGGARVLPYMLASQSVVKELNGHLAMAELGHWHSLYLRVLTDGAKQGGEAAFSSPIFGH